MRFRSADLEIYPKLDKIVEILKKYSNKVYSINATEICLDKFNSNLMVNIFMLGYAIPTEKLPFIEVEHYEEVIKEWLRDPDTNIKTLHLGIKEGKK